MAGGLLITQDAKHVAMPMLHKALCIGLLLLTTVAATSQVFVPAECVQLAIREGFPSHTMTNAQAAKARAKLARLSNSDPLVSQCKEAINRMQK